MHTHSQTHTHTLYSHSMNESMSNSMQIVSYSDKTVMINGAILTQSLSHVYQCNVPRLITGCLNNTITLSPELCLLVWQFFPVGVVRPAGWIKLMNVIEKLMQDDTQAVFAITSRFLCCRLCTSRIFFRETVCFHSIGTCLIGC